VSLNSVPPILFISANGESLPVVWRLRKLNPIPNIYIHNPYYKKLYNGMIRKTTLNGLKKTAQNAEIIVFDNVQANTASPQDKALLKLFSLPQSTPSVFGSTAEKLQSSRTHPRVLCGSTLTSVYTTDHTKNTQLSKSIGLTTPESHEFSSFDKGISFLSSKKSRWVFKPHTTGQTYIEQHPGELIQKLRYEYPKQYTTPIPYTLQQFIEGAEIITEGWFDGKQFTHFSHTIEEKRFNNANLGVMLGSQSNTTWIKRNPGFMTQEMQKLIPEMEKAGYTGAVSIKCVIESNKKHRPYCLKIRFAPRYDSLYCLLSLIRSPLSEFYTKTFNVPLYSGYASSQRISIPPYPYATPPLLRQFAENVSVEGRLNNLYMQDIVFNNGFKCAGTDGLLGVMVHRGNSIGGSVGELYREIDRLHVSSALQYRSDGGRKADKVVRKLRKWEVNIH